MAVAVVAPAPMRQRHVAWAAALGGGVVAVKTIHLALTHATGAVPTLVRQLVLVALVLVAVRAVAGHRAARVMGLAPPRRAVRWGWTVLPAVAVLAAWVVVAAARGDFDVPRPWDAARIVVATGIGEELLFRGAVYGLAARASRTLAVMLSSIAFGWWHVVDALHAIHRVWPAAVAVGFVAGTVALMTLVGVAVFAPLRRVSGSAWGPALLHASWNLGATLALGHLASAWR